MVKSAEWSESDGILVFRGKMYVPKDRDLRYNIVEQHHNDIAHTVSINEIPLHQYNIMVKSTKTLQF
jgi:hypothetical protein